MGNVTQNTDKNVGACALIISGRTTGRDIWFPWTSGKQHYQRQFLARLTKKSVNIGH